MAVTTILMPDDTVFERASILDYVVDVRVVDPGPIVPLGWRQDSGKFSLIEDDGAIRIVGKGSTRAFSGPTWVITDVWCSDPYVHVVIDYLLRVQRLSGPWLGDGIHLVNPIQVGENLPIKISWAHIEDVVRPRIALKGFIANGA